MASAQQRSTLTTILCALVAVPSGAVAFWLAGAALPNLIGGHRSWSFTEATGNITGADPGNATQAPSITYAYTANGTPYTSSRFSFSANDEHERHLCRAAAQRSPTGSTIDVFYDPADPARAVLLRGVRPLAATLAGFALPAAVASIGLGLVAITGLGRMGKPAPPGGAWIRESAEGIRFRSPGFTPASMTATVLFVGAILGGLALAAGAFYGLPGTDTIWPIVGVYAAFATICLVTPIAVPRVLRTGRLDIILDSRRAMLSFPESFLSPRRVEVPLDQITAVRADQTTTMYPGGQERTKAVIMLDWRGDDGELREIKCCGWTSIEAAREFSEWLTHQIEAARSGEATPR